MKEEEEYKAAQVMLIMEEMQDYVLQETDLNIFDKEALVHYANQISEAIIRAGVTPTGDVIQQMVADFYTAVAIKKNNGEF